MISIEGKSDLPRIGVGSKTLYETHNKIGNKAIPNFMLF